MKSIKKFIILILLTLALLACNPEEASAPRRAWIDYPIDGISLIVGEVVSIHSHGYARDGLAEALLTINGVAYRRDAYPNPGTDFDQLYQEWAPTAEGVYTLQITAFDVNGEASLPASVSVIVASPAAAPQPITENGECAPAALVAPILVAPADGATLTTDPVLEWAYPDPACHPHSYAIDIAEDPAFVDTSWGFGTLDHNETSRTWPLPGGKCYYWRARAYAPDTYGPESGVQSFCIAETPATPTFTPTVEVATCPPIATTLTGANCRSGPSPDYPIVITFAEGHTATVLGRNAESSWWAVENAGSSCWVWSDLVTLNPNTCTVPVQAAPPLPPTDTPTPTLTPTFTPTLAPDTTPPPVPAPQSPANNTTVGCASSVDLTWATVSDPSGIATYYIKLEKEISADTWQSAGGYTASTNQVNVPIDCDLRYRWMVRAEDGAGNLSDWSAPATFGVEIK